jgi:DNA-binding MarR family transcriptional regulator
MPIASSAPVSFQTTLRVRDTCVCLHVQRAARALAGRFDEALRPAGLTNSQFSLLNALNGPQPKTPGEIAAVIGADRTTVTAALKPLARRGLAKISSDPGDQRVRRVALTDEGHARLAAALPLWTEAHDALEAELNGADLGRMRHDLHALSASRRRVPTDAADDTRVSRTRISIS